MFPSAKSIVAMIGITIGAIWYVSGDILSGEGAYLYCTIFVFVACIEGGIAKDTINRYQMNSWSRTFLVNTLSIPVGIILSLFTGEFENMRKGKTRMVTCWTTRTGDLLLWCARVSLALGWVFLPC